MLIQFLSWLRRVPLLGSGLFRVYQRMHSRPPEQVFTDIYARNVFGGTASASGTGSEGAQVDLLVRELPVLFRKLSVASILDVPCGDFHWFQRIDLSGIDYLGGDIVRDLVARNQAAHERPGIAFRHLDLLKDPLPCVDLIFCRDCLVHLSHDHALAALRNICRSGSRWLLTTTFTNRPANDDIVTGTWHPLNLERAPFRFPAPAETLRELCNPGDEAFSDKSLGLWRIDDLRGVLGV